MAALVRDKPVSPDDGAHVVNEADTGARRPCDDRKPSMKSVAA
jgi:hypothetical protein